MRYTIIVEVNEDDLRESREEATGTQDESSVISQIEAECGWLEQSGITVVSITRID